MLHQPLPSPSAMDTARSERSSASTEESSSHGSVEPFPDSSQGDGGLRPSENIAAPLPVIPVQANEHSEDVYLERVPGLCLVPGDDAVFLADCGFTAEAGPDVEQRQRWLRAVPPALTRTGRLFGAAPISRADGFCLEVGSPVHLRPCNHSNPNQDWVVDDASSQVRSSQGTCLTAAAAVVGSVVSVEECGIRPGEKWRIVRPAAPSAGAILAGLTILGDVQLPAWALQALGVACAMLPWLLLALLCAARHRQTDLEPDDVLGESPVKLLG